MGERSQAVWALGKIKSKKAVEPLIKALKDEDREVRLWAAEVLEKIGTPEALKAVEEYKINPAFYKIGSLSHLANQCAQTVQLVVNHISHN